jgi:hypothetical protein
VQNSTSATPSTNTQKKKAEKPAEKQRKFGFELGAYTSNSSQSPASDYFSQLNTDFRNGKYTSTSSIPNWQNIPTPANPSSTGLEAAVTYKLNDKLSTGFIYDYSSPLALNSIYNKDATTQTGATYNFDRTEGTNINSSSVGLKAKYKISKKIDSSLAVKQSNYSVNGNVEFTMYRPDTDNTVWRVANYSGTGSGTSVELGAEYALTKNISIGISAQSNSGTVKTIGEQTRTQSSATTVSKTDYSPEFNFNSTSEKLELRVKF